MSNVHLFFQTSILDSNISESVACPAMVVLATSHRHNRQGHSSYDSESDISTLFLEFGMESLWKSIN